MKGEPATSKWTKLLRLVPAIAIGVLLLSTFWMYRSAYIWLDDFNNFHWARLTSGEVMLKALINPASRYFRPTGMAVYWFALNVLDANPTAFHILAWLLHAANTALLYAVLKRITKSRSGAAVGAMLFSSQAVFTEIYWTFGTIFELVGALLFFLGLFLWATENRSWMRVAAVTCIFVFAAKAKEMAITLPAILLCYDLIVRRNSKWRHAVQILLPGGVGVFFMLLALDAQRQTAPDAPYYMDITALVLGRGFGGYFNTLFETGYRWQTWAIGFGALLLLFSGLGKRKALFFLSYVFITFLPVIFLVNHRTEFYWYIPFLGVCGLAALLVRTLAGLAATRIPSPLAEIAACVVFAILCRSTYIASRDNTAVARSWQNGIAREYRGLISGLRALPRLPPNETLYFESVPSYFNNELLTEAAELALRRSDLRAIHVEEFPPEARYRFDFRESRLIMVQIGP